MTHFSLDEIFEYRKIDIPNNLHPIIKDNNLIDWNTFIEKKISQLRKNDKSLNIIVPHYQSSICIDDCKYCGFRKSNKGIIRKSLDDNEFAKELNLLIDWGYRVIELVYATDPNASAEIIAKRIELALNIGRKREVDLTIGLNSNTFKVNEYKLLLNAGLSFFVLWMETYNKKRYLKWHKKGTPKYDFEYRLETYDRAISAGIKHFGMGILLGLSEWKEDVLALLNHALYLEKQYQLKPFIFGVPRVKYAMNVKLDQIPNIVSDIEFKYILNIYRIIFPKTRLFFNTREDYQFNIDNLGIGGDLFTIDCATFPGAYLTDKYLQDNQMQFQTIQYNRNTIINDLKRNGFNPKFEW